MCENTNIHDRVQASIASATREVDVALESVRAMRQAILAQMARDTADLDTPTPDEVAKAIETIRRHNADTDRDIYLTDDEYMDLANKLKNQATYIGSLETEVQYQRNMDKQLTAQIQRVRKLHEPVKENNAACGEPDCCGEYEEWEQCADCQCDYPCPTIKALDGEIGSVEPVKLEALDGEQG
jgi:DNA repair exonuclease SbcCD ATPase subunit